jgi:hypothetical protein
VLNVCVSKVRGGLEAAGLIENGAGKFVAPLLRQLPKPAYVTTHSPTSIRGILGTQKISNRAGNPRWGYFQIRHY